MSQTFCNAITSSCTRLRRIDLLMGFRCWLVRTSGRRRAWRTSGGTGDRDMHTSTLLWTRAWHSSTDCAPAWILLRHASIFLRYNNPSISADHASSPQRLHEIELVVDTSLVPDPACFDDGVFAFEILSTLLPQISCCSWAKYSNLKCYVRFEHCLQL